MRTLNILYVLIVLIFVSCGGIATQKEQINKLMATIEQRSNQKITEFNERKNSGIVKLPTLGVPELKKYGMEDF